MPYDEIEKRGIFLPVSEYQIKYIKPALYDQLLTIKTYVKKLPGVRIIFEYEIYNENNEKISTAETTLFFLEAQSNKIIKCPDFLMDLILSKWEE